MEHLSKINESDCFKYRYPKKDAQRFRPRSEPTFWRSPVGRPSGPRRAPQSTALSRSGAPAQGVLQERVCPSFAMRGRDECSDKELLQPEGTCAFLNFRLKSLTARSQACMMSDQERRPSHRRLRRWVISTPWEGLQPNGCDLQIACKAIRQ